MFKLISRGLLAATTLFSSAALAAVDPESGYTLPRDISQEGWRIDGMLNFAVIATGLLFAVMVIWMAIAMIFHRDGKHKTKYDHGTSKKAAVVGLAIGFGIFFFVDGVLFYNSTVDLKGHLWNWDVMQDPNAIRVEVNARQWAWQIRYAGEDGKFATKDDVVTLNDLRVPVDTPVAVQLTASDVIHAFYLPNLRIKTDVIPGTVNPVRFTVSSKNLEASGSNEFDLACAQHCGTHHYKMKGKLTVLSKEEFNAWIEEASINSALDYDLGPTAEDQKKGVTVDEKYLAHWGWEWREF